MPIKDAVERHPAVFLFGAIVAGFAAGFGAYETILRVSGRITVPRELYVDSATLESQFVRRATHEESLTRLQEELADTRARLDQSEARLAQAAAQPVAPNLAPVQVQNNVPSPALTEDSYLIAVERNRIPDVRRHLEAGVPVDSRDSLQNPALSIALRHGYAELAEVLLEAGANPNARDSGDSTPLMLATKRGLVATIARLCERGADADAQGRHGDTALIQAALSGSPESVQTLLACGANPGVRNSFQKLAADYAAGAAAERITVLLGSD